MQPGRKVFASDVLTSGVLTSDELTHVCQYQETYLFICYVVGARFHFTKCALSDVPPNYIVSNATRTLSLLSIVSLALGHVLRDTCVFLATLGMAL